MRLAIALFQTDYWKIKKWIQDWRREGGKKEEKIDRKKDEKKRPEIAFSKVKFQKNPRGSAPGPRPPAVGWRPGGRPPADFSEDPAGERFMVLWNPRRRTGAMQRGAGGRQSGRRQEFVVKNIYTGRQARMTTSNFLLNCSCFIMWKYWYLID
jgi:hypothetical protein